QVVHRLRTVAAEVQTGSLGRVLGPRGGGLAALRMESGGFDAPTRRAGLLVQETTQQRGGQGGTAAVGVADEEDGGRHGSRQCVLEMCTRLVVLATRWTGCARRRLPVRARRVRAEGAR